MSMTFSFLGNPYPTGSTDEQIHQTVKEISEKLLYSGQSNPLEPLVVLQAVEFINLGQAELQRRVLDRSSKETSRLTRIAIGVTIIATALSLLSIYLSFQSMKSSGHWEKNQIQLLEQINELSSQAIKSNELRENNQTQLMEQIRDILKNVWLAPASASRSDDTGKVAAPPGSQ